MVSPTGPQALIAYRIRALNQAGRAAEASAPAFVPGGPSPKPVEGFQARQQKAGVVLEWRGGSSNGTSVVEVVRTRLDLLPGKQEPKAAAASTKAGFSKATDAETHLRPEQSPTGPVAAGGLKGMVDGSAASGATYTYAAYRVVTITADGRSYEIRSEPSGPVTMTMRDTFPPEVPRGLVSIPGKGSGSGESGAGATIDLAWESNTEADMAGYIVYRVDLGTASVPGTGKPLRLTAAPILAPAFRDQSVVSGHRYRYTVTSVDLSGNESAPSAAVEDAPDGR